MKLWSIWNSVLNVGKKKLLHQLRHMHTYKTYVLFTNCMLFLYMIHGVVWGKSLPKSVSLCVSSQSAVCDWSTLLLMWSSRGGRSQGEGRPVSILSNPASPFPKALMSTQPLIPERAGKAIIGQPDRLALRGCPERSVIYLRWWTSTHGPAIIHCTGESITAANKY